LREVFAEVLEDFALAAAIREGLRSKKTNRDEVFVNADRKPWRCADRKPWRL
jgi:hypothetical protein